MSTTTLPTQSHLISLANAAAMTKRYRDNLTVILNSGYSSVLPLNETFNKEALAPLIANPACKAIRIYYGMDENLLVHALFVGVTEDNEDILPPENLTEEDEDDDGVILEDSQRCPPSCPPSSPLN